jgi:hypothetical protein
VLPASVRVTVIVVPAGAAPLARVSLPWSVRLPVKAVDGPVSVSAVLACAGWSKTCRV